QGGGASQAILMTCAVVANSAEAAGGVFDSSLYYCTVTLNSARTVGGASLGHLENCIVYFNQAAGTDANYDTYAVLDYCCTTPLPATGTANISLNPQLSDGTHLTAASPCIGKGRNWPDFKWHDIGGLPLADPCSIGCEEYITGSVTGALSVAVTAPYTNVSVGFETPFGVVIDGRTTAGLWTFGDGATLSNRASVRHCWSTPGVYDVALTAFNESHPEGVSGTVQVNVIARPVHYVVKGSSNPVPPYVSIETAASDIQSAIDAASVPGSLVLAGDGVYASGGRAVDGLMTNRVVVEKPLLLQSMNGPQKTVIVGAQAAAGGNGDGAIRCVYLNEGSGLSGFTLTNGATRIGGDAAYEQKGGAIWCPSTAPLITNCLLINNRGYARAGGSYGGTLANCVVMNNAAQDGGGVYASALAGCILVGNSSLMSEGAAYGSCLTNCTVVGNSGAVAGGSMLNCISFYNTNRWGAPNNVGALMNHCCTFPLPVSGWGNFTNEPGFVNFAAGDLHLEVTSPCINSGHTADAPTGTDLDGNPRLKGGAVDVGVYEFQNPLSLLSYAWLQSNGLSTDGSADFADPDCDGMNNWEEMLAGSNPTNASSCLRLLTPAVGQSGVTVTWQSVTNTVYFLERATEFGTSRAFSNVGSNIVGHLNTTSFLDTNAPGYGPIWYRVGVQTQ
ncbi:MAG TPA: choice-of-anchor Q domain-containing protein, partial [Verrucomicrobiae bacterium]|nr:choice-of-anchor Q domain-containing protein [Verrucomicrobiae bacterium]